MKIKLDENMPAELAVRLNAIGHDCETTPQERLTGRDDETIWLAAQNEARFLVTQDLDFSDVRRFAPGTHAGLLLVRMPERSGGEIAARVLRAFEAENTTGWTGCFLVVTATKLRIRRPVSR